MLKLNEFRTYVSNLKTAVPELFKTEVVMDDSQLSKFLEALLPEKYMLLGIIPKHNYFGNIDSLQSKDKIAFLVLKKVDRKDQTHQIFLDDIAEAQEVTQKVIDKITADFTSEENCNFIKYLDPATLDINPIWNLNSCDGYEIDFSTNTNL